MLLEDTIYDGPAFGGPEVKLPPDLQIGPQLFSHSLQMPNAWHCFPWIKNKLWPVATGAGIVIGNLDTGYTPHKYGPEILSAKSYIQGQSAADGNGHGTHTIGSHSCRRDESGNSIGLAPDSKVRVYKVLSNSGSGSSGGIAQAIKDAADDGCNIITMSLGGPSNYEPQNRAIDYAWSKGCLVIAAAGNSGGSNTVGWPAKYPNCLCTGNYKENGEIASSSSGGRELDWACPGTNITSFNTDGESFRQMTGTSMATPIGAGKLACLLEVWLRQGRAMFKSAQEVRDYFTKVLIDAGAPGFDIKFGIGIANENFLVEAIIKDLALGA